MNWQRIPIWKNINRETFINYQWQTKNTIGKNNIDEFLRSLNVSEDIKKSIYLGLKIAPMSIKIPPYIIAQINWENFWHDPLRKQFLPVIQEFKEDHPKLVYDSLGERNSSPINGLVHRYPNKVLFLALSVCPLYCRFCTRAYSVGTDTDNLQKYKITPSRQNYKEIFKYLSENKVIEDVVLSGGDIYIFEPSLLDYIVKSLLEIENIKRIRIATKGICSMPMKVISHHEWRETVISLSNYARENLKQLAIHTHFNHPNEISDITKEACDILFRDGVTIRNQSVLLRHINDDVKTMSLLIKKLADINITPYYVFQSDMTKGTEYFRTPLKTIINLEKEISGSNSGFMIPKFMIDLPGGGGKRMVSTYKFYNEETGESCWESPVISKDKLYYYYDPLQI